MSDEVAAVPLKLKEKYTRPPVNGRYQGKHNDGMRRRIKHKIGRKDTWTPEAVLVIDLKNGTRVFEKVGQK